MDLAGSRTCFYSSMAEFHRSIVPQLRAKFLPPNDHLDDLLEHHTRAYILDELLSSMGWTTRPAGGDFLNLLTEAFIRREHNKPHTLFLDYLGIDGPANLPLLVFEAKRFGLAGPGTLAPAYKQKLAGRVAKANGRLEPSHPEVVAAAFRHPKLVTEEWRDHIKQLKQYYRAVVRKFGQPPTVMAIGNGEWLVIIQNPQEVFEGTPSAECFWVLDEPGQPGEAYQRHYDEIHSAHALFFSGVSPDHLAAGHGGGADPWTAPRLHHRAANPTAAWPATAD